MNQPTDGRVLLVGEGNFSLSASLVSSGILSGPQVITSCLDTRGAIEDAHRLAASNIVLLEEAGASVLFEVDARELHNHPEIKFFEFSRVIFNFPLADRHNIKKNRALLSEFFNSAVRIIDRQKGQIMVTLCKGQGGTPADQPMRSWHDSWQVVSMATDAGLILREILPFNIEDYCSYESVGFRFQDKGFNTENALIHVFETAATVRVPESTTGRCVFPQGDENFVVPVYIRHKLDSWSLLDKENHPIAILHQHVAISLRSHGPVLELPSNDSRLPRVLPGYKSVLSMDDASATGMEAMDTEEVDQEDGGDGVGDISDDTSSVPSSKQLKEMKNRACAASSSTAGDTLETAKRSLENEKDARSKSFMHGVDRGGDARQRSSTADASSSKDGKSAGASTVGSSTQKLFLLPVYVVHKTQGSSGTHAAVGDATSSDEVKHAEADVNMQTSQGEEEKVACTENPGRQQGEARSDSTAANALYHLRCSLLENVPDLLGVMKGCSAKQQTALMSGIVFRKCPVSPAELPVSHETLILSQSQGVTADDLANQLCVALREALREDMAEKLKVQRTNCSISIADLGCATVVFKLQLQGPAGMALLGQVFRFDSSTDSTAQKPDSSSASSNSASPTHAIFSQSTVGSLLYLDEIVRVGVCLPDVRLLWSEDPRFSGQFGKEHGRRIPLSDFKAFSLYPVRFVHDISFWENPDRVFDEAELMDIVRDVADDAVVKMTLIDKFENADSGKTSRCYRLVFQSHDRALSYITSWKLQSMVRLTVAHHLGVTLR